MLYILSIKMCLKNYSQKLWAAALSCLFSVIDFAFSIFKWRLLKSSSLQGNIHRNGPGFAPPLCGQSAVPNPTLVHKGLLCTPQPLPCRYKPDTHTFSASMPHQFEMKSLQITWSPFFISSYHFNVTNQSKTLFPLRGDYEWITIKALKKAPIIKDFVLLEIDYWLEITSSILYCDCYTSFNSLSMQTPWNHKNRKLFHKFRVFFYRLQFL